MIAKTVETRILWTNFDPNSRKLKEQLIFKKNEFISEKKSFFGSEILFINYEVLKKIKSLDTRQKGVIDSNLIIRNERPLKREL